MTITIQDFIAAFLDTTNFPTPLDAYQFFLKPYSEYSNKEKSLIAANGVIKEYRLELMTALNETLDTEEVKQKAIINMMDMLNLAEIEIVIKALFTHAAECNIDSSEIVKFFFSNAYTGTNVNMPTIAFTALLEIKNTEKRNKILQSYHQTDLELNFIADICASYPNAVRLDTNMISGIFTALTHMPESNFYKEMKAALENNILTSLVNQLETLLTEEFGAQNESFTNLLSSKNTFEILELLPELSQYYEINKKFELISNDFIAAFVMLERLSKKHPLLIFDVLNTLLTQWRTVQHEVRINSHEVIRFDTYFSNLYLHDNVNDYYRHDRWILIANPTIKLLSQLDVSIFFRLINNLELEHQFKILNAPLAIIPEGISNPQNHNNKDGEQSLLESLVYLKKYDIMGYVSAILFTFSAEQILALMNERFFEYLINFEFDFITTLMREKQITIENIQKITTQEKIIYLFELVFFNHESDISNLFNKDKFDLIDMGNLITQLKKTLKTFTIIEVQQLLSKVPTLNKLSNYNTLLKNLKSHLKTKQNAATQQSEPHENKREKISRRLLTFINAHNATEPESSEIEMTEIDGVFDSEQCHASVVLASRSNK